MSDLFIDREQVLQTATLAKLALRDDEVTRMHQELQTILHYMQVLREVDAREVQTISQSPAFGQPLRDDEPRSGLAREQVLEQSALDAHGGFVVPAFVDE
jgi:aspartyl-tRNA(Asn)/glutamyl-tRNA(Gln) amidotransferase subunit C